MKRIMVLFTLVMLIMTVGIGYAQDYTGNAENDPLYYHKNDDDFFLEKEDADSTLIILNAAAGSQDTVITKAHYTLGYNKIMPVIISCEADSTNVKAVVQNGIYNKYTEAYVWADVDSIEITGSSQAVNPPQAISIPGGKFFRLSIRTEDGNAWSQATELRFWYRRYR